MVQMGSYVRTQKKEGALAEERAARLSIFCSSVFPLLV